MKVDIADKKKLIFHKDESSILATDVMIPLVDNLISPL